MTDKNKLICKELRIAHAGHADEGPSTFSDAAEAIEALETERDAIKLQAQCWKCEANAQKATVQEIFQLCTGATGELGDWNGAEPVRKLIAERDALRAEVVRLKEQKEVMRLEYKELELQLTEDENIERDRDNALAERDALQAQLAAAQGQSLPILQVSAFVEGFLDEVEEPPERNCRCHISPPCNDCVDHSCLRELFLDARRLVKTIAELGAAPIPQQVAEPSCKETGVCVQSGLYVTATPQPKDMK